MSTPPRPALILTLVAATALHAACLSRSYPDKQRYVLEVERPVTPPVAAAASGASRARRVGVLRVERVWVSPVSERKGFVYRTAEATYEDDFYNEFFTPPGLLLRKVILDWMTASGIFSEAIDATDGGRPRWLLESRVEKLYADFRDPGSPSAVAEIRFTLIDNRSPRLAAALQKSYAAAEPVAGTDAAEITAAWNVALERILTDLEADLAQRLSR